MGDSDETPRRPGAKRLQTATRLQTPTQREMASDKARRDRVQTPARGVTIGRPSLSTDQIDQLAIAVEGTTITVDAIPEEIDFESVSGVTETMLENPDLIALVEKLERFKKTSANALMKAMGDKPPAERMSTLERRLRRIWMALVPVAIAAVSALVTAGHYLIEKTRDDQRIIDERQQLLDHDRDYEQRLRSLEAVTPRFPFGPTRPDLSPVRKEPTP